MMATVANSIHLKSILVVIAVALVPVLGQNFPLVTDSRCNCYRTNTTTSDYFVHHKFFDFRELSQYAGVPAPIDSAQAAPTPFVTSPLLRDSGLDEHVVDPDVEQQWAHGGESDVTGSDATVLMVNSENNIYIRHNDDYMAGSSTYLVLRTVRHEAFQSAAEIESTSLGYQFMSLRMKARTRGDPGAITAMFTYRGAPQLAQVQEADLEIRTRDPPYSIQYTNQPSWNADGDVPQATRNVTRPGHVDWGGWQHHRMDWSPGSSSWFVDGQLTSSIQFQAPRDPSRVMFNTWSDGGSWSGNMTVGTIAEMQIQWIDFVYNTTDTTPTPTPVPELPGYPPSPGSPGPAVSCANVCSIDQTSKLGTPVLISQPAGGQDPGSGQGCASARYGQCAGKTWSGCTSCADGTSCRFQNDYYSQCL